MGIPLGRGTMALWMIRIGGTFLVPLINLLERASCSPSRLSTATRPACRS